MLLKIFSPLAVIALIVISSVVLIPQSAWSADLRLRPKPIVRHDSASDWRTRLFEDFRRYLRGEISSSNGSPEDMSAPSVGGGAIR